MAFQLSALALGVSGVALLIVIIGFILYILRNYCQKRIRNSQANSSGRKRLTDIDTVRTTTDDETSSTVKLHTLEQILKNEEKSYVSGKAPVLIPLKFQTYSQITTKEGPISPKEISKEAEKNTPKSD